MKDLFFKEALKEAQKAVKKNEVPIGAVLVHKHKIIARAHNQTEKNNFFGAHAEFLCLLKATKKLKTKYLNHGELYCTLEPCRLCEAAARLCRIQSIYYLLPSKKFGAHGKGYFKTKKSRANNNLSNQALSLLQDFFKNRR